MQGSALDEGGGHRATTLVKVGLDGNTLSSHVRVGTQVQRRVSGQDDGLEEVVKTLVGTSGDVDKHRVTAVLLWNQTVLGELSAHLVRIGFRLVDLVRRSAA